MPDLRQQIAETIGHIRRRWNRTPKAGIILGTGLGILADSVQAEAVWKFDELPHFPESTAPSHKGRLVCGMLANVPVAVMDGRFHLYEGYSAQQATFSVRVLKALNVELLIVSNASGGLNPSFNSGDVMVIHDHIDLMSANPLIGVNDETLGPRFPDMSRPYDPSLVERVLKIARRNSFAVHAGVYAALSGPNYESRAEYRFLRTIGADAVGMSTVPEAIVAAHCRLPVLALSVITNMCVPDRLSPTQAGQVVDTAQSAEPIIRQIVVEVLTEESNRRTETTGSA